MKNKLKFLLLILSLSLLLSSCKEKEHYESRDVNVETVFDTIELNKNNEVKEEEETEQLEEEENENNKNNDKLLEKAQVLDGGINLRSAPEFGDNVVIQSESGMEITILEQNIGEDSKWAKIEYDELIYYINMEVLK